MKYYHCNEKELENTLPLWAIGMTFLFVLPLSIYRLISGDYLFATIDLALTLILIGSFLQQWQSKKIKYFNTFAVTCYSIAVLSIIYLKNSEMIFWSYPVIVANYFFLKSRLALIANGFFIVGVIAITAFFQELPAIGVYPSLMLVGIFGFLFSRRAEANSKILKRLVSEDELTRIKNRRSFNEKIEEILAENKRAERPVCLLLLDLDFFKKINDLHGHKQGDLVLINFAQTVKSTIRNTDNIYRFGGEEFVVIANNSSLEHAGNFADNIRQSVQNTQSLAKFDITVSIGVSEINRKDDADSFFRRADLALYESKSKGRNRVYLAKQDDDGSINLSKFRSKPKLIHTSTSVSNCKDEVSLSGKSSFLSHPHKNKESSTL